MTLCNKPYQQIHIICLCSYLWCVSFNLSGEQIEFKKNKQQQGIQFNYQWVDSASQTQQLEFLLPTNQFNRQTHKRFVSHLAQQYIYIALHKAAQKIDPREATVTIQRQPQNIQVKVNSRSEKLLTKWQSAMKESEKEAFDQYLQDNYYSRFMSYLGQEAIKPDHLRYINENKLPLLPVAQGIYEKLPQNSESRTYINVLLSWVQSIPYNALENRMTSNGAGFLPPLAVIGNNQGDCDSKSVLTASLIRSLLPDVKLVMLYLPQHALLGISLPFRNDEATFNINGVDYLLFDPTGPAVFPLGIISPKSNTDIANGLYSYEQIP